MNHPGWGAVLCACAPLAVSRQPAEHDDEPADAAFLRKVAQEYYEALVLKDFRKTADRGIFVVMASKPDLAAYARAMQDHPYAVAERIAVEIADIDPARAYLQVKLTADGQTFLKRATWSRTGTPKTWVAEMTRMTMAGMPGYEIIPDDYVAPPRVVSSVRAKKRNSEAETCRQLITDPFDLDFLSRRHRGTEGRNHGIEIPSPSFISVSRCLRENPSSPRTWISSHVMNMQSP